MKQLLACLALIACHASPAPAEVIPEVRAAAAAFDDAQLRGDRAALERFLAQDFVFARGSGALAGRAEFLAGFGEGLTLEPFTILHPVFVRLGDRAAIVGGEVTLSGRDHGTPFARRIRYADVFVYRDGRWQVVYVQVTAMP